MVHIPSRLKSVGRKAKNAMGATASIFKKPFAGRRNSNIIPNSTEVKVESVTEPESKNEVVEEKKVTEEKLETVTLPKSIESGSEEAIKCPTPIKNIISDEPNTINSKETNINSNASEDNIPTSSSEFGGPEVAVVAETVVTSDDNPVKQAVDLMVATCILNCAQKAVENEEKNIDNAVTVAEVSEEKVTTEEVPEIIKESDDSAVKLVTENNVTESDKSKSDEKIQTVGSSESEEVEPKATGISEEEIQPKDTTTLIPVQIKQKSLFSETVQSLALDELVNVALPGLNIPQMMSGLDLSGQLIKVVDKSEKNNETECGDKESKTIIENDKGEAVVPESDVNNKTSEDSEPKSQDVTESQPQVTYTTAPKLFHFSKLKCPSQPIRIVSTLTKDFSPKHVCEIQQIENVEESLDKLRSCVDKSKKLFSDVNLTVVENGVSKLIEDAPQLPKVDLEAVTKKAKEISEEHNPVSVQNLNTLSGSVTNMIGTNNNINLSTSTTSLTGTGTLTGVTPGVTTTGTNIHLHDFKFAEKLNESFTKLNLPYNVPIVSSSASPRVTVGSNITLTPRVSLNKNLISEMSNSITKMNLINQINLNQKSESQTDITVEVEATVPEINSESPIKVAEVEVEVEVSHSESGDVDGNSNSNDNQEIQDNEIDSSALDKDLDEEEGHSSKTLSKDSARVIEDNVDTDKLVVVDSKDILEAAMLDNSLTVQTIEVNTAGPITPTVANIVTSEEVLHVPEINDDSFNDFQSDEQSRSQSLSQASESFKETLSQFKGKFNNKQKTALLKTALDQWNNSTALNFGHGDGKSSSTSDSAAGTDCSNALLREVLNQWNANTERIVTNNTIEVQDSDADSEEAQKKWEFVVEHLIIKDEKFAKKWEELVSQGLENLKANCEKYEVADGKEKEKEVQEVEEESQSVDKIHDDDDKEEEEESGIRKRTTKTAGEEKEE